MTEPLYGRRCVAILSRVLARSEAVGGDATTITRDYEELRVSDLRMIFKVEKNVESEPNTLDLAIYNLAAPRRALVQQKHLKVRLLAGYEGASGPAELFSGGARQVYSKREGPDWVTRILCGDGEDEYRNTFFSGSFRAGTRLSDAAKNIAETLRRAGLGLGNLPAQVGGYVGPVSTFEKGVSVHGRAYVELQKVLKTMGFQMSVQDGQLQVLRETEAAPSTAVVLGPDSGLIGSPEHGTPEEKGGPSLVKARSLVQPRFRAGGPVILEAASFKGQYRVQKLRHTGDTAGGEWYSDIEARPL